MFCYYDDDHLYPVEPPDFEPPLSDAEEKCEFQAELDMLEPNFRHERRRRQTQKAIARQSEIYCQNQYSIRVATGGLVKLHRINEFGQAVGRGIGAWQARKKNGHEKKSLTISMDQYGYRENSRHRRRSTSQIISDQLDETTNNKELDRIEEYLKLQFGPLQEELRQTEQRMAEIERHMSDLSRHLWQIQSLTVPSVEDWNSFNDSIEVEAKGIDFEISELEAELEETEEQAESIRERLDEQSRFNLPAQRQLSTRKVRRSQLKRKLQRLEWRQAKLIRECSFYISPETRAEIAKEQHQVRTKIARVSARLAAL